MADNIFNMENLRNEDFQIIDEVSSIKITPYLKVKDLKENLIHSEEFKVVPEYLASFITTTVEDTKEKQRRVC